MGTNGNNCYSSKYDLKKEKELKEKLKSNGFELKPMNHAFWRAQGSGITITLYNSGKILVQGKNTKYFLANYLNITLQEQVTQASLIEHQHYKYSSWIGTDESGKGDYFGPLVVAGVLIDETNKEIINSLGVQDSKKLTDSNIEKLAIKIKENTINSVVVINPDKYNQLYESFKNLNKLLAWGHARVIENILEKKECENALSDKFGDESLIKNALKAKGVNINLEQRVRAEDDLAVAAASILARNEFVKRIKKLSELYNVELPKGSSQKVKDQARYFIQHVNKNNLGNIAKLHFKITKEL